MCIDISKLINFIISYKKYIVLIILLVIVGVVYYGSVEFLFLAFTIFTQHTSTLSLISGLVFAVFYFMLIIYIPYLFIGIIYKYFRPNAKIKWWFIFTVLIMAFSLLLGIVIVNNYLLGLNNTVTFLLNDENKGLSNVDQLNCKTIHSFIVDDIVNCNSSLDINNKTLIISFILKNDSTIQETFDKFDAFSFIGKDNVKRLFFEVHGIDSANKNTTLTSGVDFEFMTKSQYEEKKKLFVAYIFGLFGLVFISIPSMMSNLRKLKSDK